MIKFKYISFTKANRFYKLFCCIVIVVISAFQKTYAQPKPFPFTQFEFITIDKGLSNSSAYDVLQDKQGFMWFLTGNGWQRYDGYSFKNFDVPGFFFNMKQADNGMIWMCDCNAGIYQFNPITGKHKFYPHKPGDNNSLNDEQSYGVLPVKGNVVWIPTLNGLDKLDANTDKFMHYMHRENDSTTISDNFLTSCCMDEEGMLWVTTAKPGIDCFNPQTGKVIHHFNFGSKVAMTGDANSGIFCVRNGNNGNLWIASRDNGYSCYNTRTKILKEYKYPKEFAVSGFGASNCFVFEDSKNNLWFVGDNGGLNYLETTSNSFYHIDLVPILNKSIGATINFFEDANHDIWVATDKGVLIVHTQSKPFKLYNQGINYNHPIFSNNVASMFRDSRGKFYVGAGKLYEASNDFKSFTELSFPFNGTGTERADPMQIIEDNNHDLWFGSFLGLIHYNPVKKIYKWYKYDARDSTTVSAQSITGIIQDKKGRYWCTAWGGGFNAFDPVTEKFRRFKKGNATGDLITNSVGNTMMDSNGLIYMLGWKSGLIQFNPETEKFKCFVHDEKNPYSISADDSYDFLQAKNGLIYVCSYGGGLNVFNPVTEKFRAFKTNDGLASNFLMSISEDNEGNLWIGTDKGLSRFIPPKNPFDTTAKFSFRNYDVSDGIASNVSAGFGSYKDTDGTIFIGTADKGFYSFKPDELTDNQFIPPVKITGLKLFNQEIVPLAADSILKKPIELTDEIFLNYNQNQLSFEFAALNYNHSEKNKYAFMLEGYDNHWTNTDATKRFAYYTNLEPAEYIFKVKGSNNDGVWNETPRELKIIIAPPYWQRAWFRLLIAAIFLGIIYGFYRYRLNQILLLQKIRNKIAADLHDDIGSTLNSISIYSEVAKKDLSRQQFALDMIGISSRKIVESMSDIVWSINPENDHFDKIILRMRSISYTLMRAKKIEFIFRADEKLNELKLTMDARRNFYLIFKEALNNLVKYSNASRASVLLMQNGKQVSCIIHDDGVGFDVNEKYNGNGLNNMRRRAKEINANIKIESEKNKGTRVEVILNV